MDADLQACVAFHLTGRRPDAQLDAISGLQLQPAVFSGYRDLTRLRYDFPLVLVGDRGDGAFVETLSGLIDGILDRIARGGDSERLRKHVLRLEQEIRSRVAGGSRGLLSEIWDQAARTLIQSDKTIGESLSYARANLKTDGELADCDAALPYHLLGHAWGLTQRQRARDFNTLTNRLILKLSDILNADFANSGASKTPDKLKASFGSGPLDRFDFDSMSRILSRATPPKKLSEGRRKRVEDLLSTLRKQRFFPADPSSAGAAQTPYPFAFDSCSEALEAYRTRQPEAVALSRAIAIAEMEIRGDYNESKHDALFEAFGENGLDARDSALFPDYLVRIPAARLKGSEQATLDEILSAELPIRILVQTDDVIEPSPVRSGHLAFALRSRQLAGMAMGMGGVFVLQAPGPSLYTLRDSLRKGLNHAGPALFSIYSGAGGTAPGITPYLLGAAALESRVFPAFTFDPSAGPDWASRFSLAANPQRTLDWPLRELAYEDEARQTLREHLPFTLLDFVACDARYSRHFARVPKSKWNDGLIPAGERIAREDRTPVEQVPYLLMIDPENRLQRVVVDEKMLREARRCRTQWNSLQELGGIHNSHALRLLEKERGAWEADAAASHTVDAVATQGSAPAAAALPAGAMDVSAASTETEPEPSPDEAYIETARCSTCNECVTLNPKMFAYDGNRQAYIADVSAGTYAQLVEAAENCQVSIIHPGKPRNPAEPGLEELIKRAEAFL